jgi:hypothetical protein
MGGRVALIQTNVFAPAGSRTGAGRVACPSLSDAIGDGVVLTMVSTLSLGSFLVPSDHAWFRNWTVSRILVDTLRDLGLHCLKVARAS